MPLVERDSGLSLHQRPNQIACYFRTPPFGESSIRAVGQECLDIGASSKGSRIEFEILGELR